MARKPTTNPRQSAFRRRVAERYRVLDLPCAICHGRLGPIHYNEPRDPKHPLSLCIDEIMPVCRWRESGYSSPEAACHDIKNLQPTHRVCNAAKGAKLPTEKKIISKVSVVSAQW